MADFGLTRREFIQGSMAGAAALSFPNLVQDPKPVGFAILGLGGYATNQILPNMKFCKLAKPVALISGTPAKLDKFGAEYGIDPSMRFSYDQMDRIRDIPEIEVVYIITPPGTHRDFTVHAAKLGKHVCCEKPMANSVAECQEMIDACARAGRQLQIGYRCHYETYNMRAMQICRKGELGLLRSINASMGFSAQRGIWRLNKKLGGGGSMYDIGIYGLQALQYLSGEAPTEVYATISNPPNDDRFKEVEDTVHFTLKFPSGLNGMCSSSYSWSGVNRYEVLGTRGRLVAENATGYNGFNFTSGMQPITLPAGNMWADQMDHLATQIRAGEKTNRTPGEMGRQDIRIIHAIYESAKSGRPVTL
jgi:predicted dehydrogenase